MTTYATVQQFRKMYDVRLIAELGGDSGSPGSATEQNDILTTALARASADVRSYALRGELYSATDLDSLYAIPDWTLIGLVCDLAIENLFSRRAGSMPDDIREKIGFARKTLMALRDGAQVFNVAATIAAGLPAVSVIRASTRASLGLVSDQPFFPTRRTQSY